MGEAIITRRSTTGGGSGGEVDFNFPEFTYTGEYSMNKYAGGNWVISFLTSGTLNITKVGSIANGVDIFLVGGGGNGTADSYRGDNQYGTGANYIGGDGGGGGYITTEKGVNLNATSYLIEIGSAEGTTSGFGFSAAGANGATGSTTGGAGVAAMHSTSGAGKNGQYAFGEADFYHYMGAGYRFAASGSGGSGYSGGGTNASVGAAGKDGAGKGASYRNPGTNAEANSGSGAGGCGGYPSTAGGGNTKGKGGSGIIIMRNMR